MPLKSIVLALVAIVSLVASARVDANPVERWGVFEAAFPGPEDGNPFVDVTLTATFTRDAQTLVVPGFYDGGGTYRVRFSPPTPGEWTYRTTSNRPALDGKTGTVTTVAPAAKNHGPVVVHKTFHLAYADGTPYYQVGTTCYAWTHQPEALQVQTLATLATSPFNKLRMCLFPKSYTYNANEPDDFPFARDAEGRFDFARFDPKNWQRFERRVADLDALGIQADLILFHPYDRWGFAEMDDATDDRYLRYAIARLSAYRNVWWSVANEYDFMIPPLRHGQRGNKTLADFDRFLAILQTEDPHARLRGIHHAAKIYDHAKSTVTHASIQHRDLTRVLDWRERYRKPIVVDECRYEGNISNSWGNIKGPDMVRQFWVGTVCGGYVGHGETLKTPDDVLWWSKGGVLHGESPPRIAFLRKTMEALPYTDMTPARLSPDLLSLGKPGEAYLVYALKPAKGMLNLPGDRSYAVEAIDTWNMKITSLGTTPPGDYAIDAPAGDYLLRLTPTPRP